MPNIPQVAKISGSALGREIDDLGVATAFEVEDTVFGPAMLVIADQGPGAIRGQGRLTRPGKTEENSNIAFLADIGGAVHRQNVTVRQHVVKVTEDRLLNFTRVLGAGDQNHAFLEIHHDRAI